MKGAKFSMYKKKANPFIFLAFFFYPSFFFRFFFPFPAFFFGFEKKIYFDFERRIILKFLLVEGQFSEVFVSSIVCPSGIFFFSPI